MCGCEAHVDWSMANKDQQFYEIFEFGEPKKEKQHTIAMNIFNDVNKVEQRQWPLDDYQAMLQKWE